jgi:hypothetical protein
MMNVYKKTIMAAVVFAAVSFGGVALAQRCQSCAEKMAIKQSIKDALAAALAANPAVAREKELDTEIEKCGCSKPKPKPGRAAHVVADSSAGCASEATCCMLTQQLQDLACANAACCKVVHRINDRVKEQGRDAKKCCHKVREDLEDIEDLVISVIDQSAECCSTTEALLVSLIDQEADCCSVIETRIGDLDNSELPIPANVASISDNLSLDLDVITWLKSIYELVGNIYFCTCQIP